MYEIREVLRLWMRGEGLRSIERLRRPVGTNLLAHRAHQVVAQLPLPSRGWTARRFAATSPRRSTPASTAAAGRGAAWEALVANHDLLGRLAGR